MMHVQSEQGASLESALRVVVEYKEALRVYLPYHIVDETRLPLEKERLKDAIKLLFARMRMDEEVKASLRFSYYQLSKFQPDVEALTILQKQNMERYDECLKRDGVQLDEEHRLAHHTLSNRGYCDESDLEIVEAERRRLETELSRWEKAREKEERKRTVHKAMTQINDYFTSRKADAEQPPERDK
jgi:hypothetical protein